MINKLKYWNRIFSTYFFQKKSNLSFWHGKPTINSNSSFSHIDQYYMLFDYKADYKGEYDANGIPMLNYHGDIGLQYNPIAIAQWGLGNYNIWKNNKSRERYDNFMLVANWLVENLEENKFGIFVWNHKFNWPYKEKLNNPWYSGLAQGQGLSVLVRAFKETKDEKYINSARKVYASFLKETNYGGVTSTDTNNNIWIEEYIISEPTHILNGFIWALWGIYDYWLLTNDNSVKKLFDKYIITIIQNINNYDIGYWSLYELSGLKIKMRTSIFYHRLHIVQLKILFNMTNIEKFNKVSIKWSGYLESKVNIYRSTIMKVIFKLMYY
tara:strand:+ start:237 stop:1211 length:975 start_codon:yes stop_codon:yes gene_type:complete